MRLNDIILLVEATPGQLVKTMGDNLVSAWGDQTGEELGAKQVMDHIVKLIPKDKTNTYIGWLTKQFIKGELHDIRADDVGKEVLQTLEYHSKASQSNPRYADPETYKTFNDMYTSTMVGVYRLRDEGKNKNKTDNIEVWKNVGKKGSGAEIEEWIKGIMYRANSTRAIYALGSRRWCVSHGKQREDVRDNHCIIYSDNWNDNEPFFVLDLDGEKYGVYPGISGSQQFVDHDNNQLSNDEIRDLLGGNPKVHRLMKPYITDDEWHPYDTSTPEGAYNFITDPKNWDYDYEELEEVIAGSAEYSYKYAVHVDDEPYRFELGEPAISGDTEYAYHYAINVIQGRWKEGEPAIHQNYAYWDRYLEMLDTKGVTDDVEGELKTAYHPNPQMNLFSENFKRWCVEFILT